MAITSQIITVDITPGHGAPKYINVSQNDVGRPITIAVTDKGASLDLTGYSVSVEILKPDGNIITEAGTVSGNSVSFETTEQMTAVAGKCIGELRIYADGDDIGSANFYFMVEESPEATGLESESVVNNIRDLIDQEIAQGGGGGGGGAVSSVNGKTGAVVLDASDVGALPSNTPYGTYSKPSGGIPASDLARAVQTSLGKADTALQSHQPLTAYQTKSITDTGNYFTTDTVEGALQEIGAEMGGKADEMVEETKLSTDTSATLVAGHFYTWPEMTALTVTAPASGMCGFRFTSGSTATTLTVTGATMPDSFTVEANRVYEINIYNGYGVAASWSVSS